MTKYFISDFHFGDKSVIKWERTQFKDIQEHDNFIINLMRQWASMWKTGDEFWFLGDWVDTKYLPHMQVFSDAGIKTHFVKGNHDVIAAMPEFEKWFDEVHLYPVFLSNRLVVSHIPVSIALGGDIGNIHGHLHNSYLDCNNYKCVSLHVRQYKPFSDQKIERFFSNIKPRNYTFLEEPYAAMYCFKGFEDTRQNMIYDKKTGLIDLPATKAYNMMMDKKPERGGSL